jgi:crotonobetainyl-CoA:carnitine CoA-transferase CaiB-like acyl-CoA transferase
MAHVEALMTEAGVPAGRINRAPEMVADPHFAARESIVAVTHPAMENLKMQNVFPKLSRTPGHVAWPGPELGAHNADVYGELLGADAGQIERWRAAGII